MPDWRLIEQIKKATATMPLQRENNNRAKQSKPQHRPLIVYTYVARENIH